MARAVPRRIATTIMNALKGGVVPRIGLEYIAVGRTLEIEALLNDTEVIQDGGAAFRFIVGKFGSGKSFLMQTIRNNAMERGFVVADADLATDRRLTGTGGQGLNTYRELIKNISTKTSPDGGALALILEKWISAIQTEVIAQADTAPGTQEFDAEVTRRIHVVAHSMEGMVNGFDFAQVVIAYWTAHKAGDEEKKVRALRWFRGEYATRTEAKRELGVNFIVTDDNWYDFIKLFAAFLVKAGYKGLLVLIDELINIYKLPNVITRQYNYERILTMYNDVLQGKARHIGIVMSGTPQSITDTRRGVFSYEALRSRLSEGRFATSGIKDLLAPIINLEPLTSEEMYVLIERLAQIHADLHGYAANATHEDLVHFLKVEYGRIGANANITPREVIRDFIELLNIAYQSKGQSIASIMHGKNFEFAPGALAEQSAENAEDDEYMDIEV